MATATGVAAGLTFTPFLASARRSDSCVLPSVACESNVPSADVRNKPSPNGPALSPTEFRSFPLINVYDESPDSKVLRFAFPEADMELGMNLCSCLVLKFTDDDGKEVVRPYTPISRVHQWGYFEVLVKNYKESKMGNHLHKMKLGQTIEAKGPFEKFPYKKNQYKHIGMIAAGTGITPMFQLLREMFKETDCKTEVNLIYANRRKEDVLLGNELNELMELYPAFAPYFVLSDPPQNWMGGIGHVNATMIKQFMPSPTKVVDGVILVCGPPSFMQAISGDKDFTKSPPTQGDLSGVLKDLGYNSRQVYKF